MPKLLFAFPFLALAMVFSGDRPADDWVWSAPGWYGFADAQRTNRIISGPYADERTCTAQLPRDKAAQYFCQFLNDEPAWN